MADVKIKLLCSMAGSEVLPAGTVIKTNEKEAASMVAAGYAIYQPADESEQIPKKRTRRTTKK